MLMIITCHGITLGCSFEVVMIPLQCETAGSAHCHTVGSSRDWVQAARLLVLCALDFVPGLIATNKPALVFNRPGVAGAVLQSPPSLINSLIY